MADTFNLHEKSVRVLEKGIRVARPIVWIHGGAMMSEAKQLHDDLMRALLSIVPRRAYQNSHRLSRLSWAVIGLCLTHTVRLGAWAEVADQSRQVSCRSGAPLLPVAASTSHPPTAVVCAHPAGSAPRLVTRRPCVCGPGYHGTDPLCADLRLTHLPRSCHPAGLAGHAPQKYHGWF